MSNGNIMIILLTIELTKTIQLPKMIYFSEPCSNSKKQIKVKLDLSNYATKSAWKNARDFAKKANLVNLKSNTDELDIDKLKKFQVELV